MDVVSGYNSFLSLGPKDSCVLADGAAAAGDSEVSRLGNAAENALETGDNSIRLPGPAALRS